MLLSSAIIFIGVVFILHLSSSFELQRRLPLGFRGLRMSSHQASIEVYSAPGCKYCRIAKSKLQEIRLDYQDIDVSSADDVLESLSALQQERLAFTLTTTVPQIYVGTEHIGGCDNLLEEIKTGRLDERLKAAGISRKEIVDTERVDTSSDTSLTCSPSNNGPTPAAALMPLPGEPLNSPRFLRSDGELTSVRDVSAELQQLAVRITEQFLDNSGKLSVAQAAHSPLFADYVALSAQLARPELFAELAALSAQGKLVFFCNLYNAFVLHASVLLPPPAPTPHDRTRYYRGETGAVYRIAGLDFSLDDVEHGVLRCNQPHPSNPSAPFWPLDDARLPLSIPQPHFDPRIHFILNCGARSCPPIRVLREEGLERALSGAARAYLLAETQVQHRAVPGADLVVSLPRLLLWYGRDFGADLRQQLERVGGLLGGELGEQLRRVAQGSVSEQPSPEDPSDPARRLLVAADGTRVSVQYNVYDWTPIASS